MGGAELDLRAKIYLRHKPKARAHTKFSYYIGPKGVGWDLARAAALKK